MSLRLTATVGGVVVGVVLTAGCAGNTVNSATRAASGLPGPTQAGKTGGGGMAAKRNAPISVPHSGPCAGGTRLRTPADADELAVKAPLLIPSADLASFSNLTELWQCPAGDRGQFGYTALFSTGIEVDARPGWNVADPASYWNSFVRDNGYGTVTEVRGTPGEMQDPTAQNRGAVQFFDHGWLIGVAGNHKMSAGSLLTVANSM